MNAKKSWKAVVLGGVLLGVGALAEAAEVGVRLEDPPSTGSVALVLFDSANTFGDFRDPVMVARHPLDGRELYRMENIPPGEYALMVYYDENGNDRIDKNFIGIPKEPLGFSNDYRPKGPPSYSRALFVLGEGEERAFDVMLYRPLGKRGRLGVGLGVIARSTPYRDYDAGVYQVIPAISYNGERFQVFGPNFQVGLLGSGKLRLAAMGVYRIGVYEEDESDFLEGMGDREDTFMAGLSLQAEMPGGAEVTVRYAHDVLDRIGGGEMRVELDKSFQIGRFNLSPEVGLNWMSAELSNHDFGVPAAKATPGRAAYDPGDALSVEGGLGIFVELTRDWLMILSAGVEFLDGRVTDSPIVSEDYVIKGFAAVTRVF